MEPSASTHSRSVRHSSSASQLWPKLFGKCSAVATWFSSCSFLWIFLPSMWKQAKPAPLAVAWTCLVSTWLGRNHAPPLLASTSDSSASSGMELSLFTDAAEVVVVVFGVVEIAAVARNDAPCAARAHVRRLHRIFAVVAVLLARQRAFAVAEHRAILRVGKGPALVDQRERVARLGRKRRGLDLGHRGGGRHGLLRARRRREHRKGEGQGADERARAHQAAPARARFSASLRSKRSPSLTWPSWVPSLILSMPSCALTLKTSFLPSTASRRERISTVRPGGVAARCDRLTWVPSDCSRGQARCGLMSSMHAHSASATR